MFVRGPPLLLCFAGISLRLCRPMSLFLGVQIRVALVVRLLRLMLLSLNIASLVLGEWRGIGCDLRFVRQGRLELRSLARGIHIEARSFKCALSVKFLAWRCFLVTIELGCSPLSAIGILRSRFLLERLGDVRILSFG